MTSKQKMVAVFVTLILFFIGFWVLMKPDILLYQDDLLYYSGRHIRLVAWSMLGALSIGIPVGIILSRPFCARFAENIMQIFNVGNAIPTMAVLALALVMLGIGDGPAIVALILASLLPIVRNTYEGLKRVPNSLLEAAKGIGMTPSQSLWQVELPNSIPIVIGGIRTALAINVGTAPLSFIIGGDSLGGLIFPGIYLNNPGQLLLGAAATAMLALALDMLVASCGLALMKKRGLA